MPSWVGFYTLILELDPQEFAVRTLAKWTLDLRQQNSLTVTKNGTGSGTVSSAPAGINCGPDCGVQSAPFSGTVQLNASAAPGFHIRRARGAAIAPGPVRQRSYKCGRVISIASPLLLKEGFTISVTVVGGGNIQSFPAGIDCGGGGTLCTASFPFGPGALIALNSNPAAGNFLRDKLYRM